jgi:hypothetical protein
MKDELWVIIVPAKLFLYWLAIFIVFHKIGWRKVEEPPKLRWSFLAAIVRFGAGLLMAIPLGLLTANKAEGLILLVWVAARFAAWVVALYPFYRRFVGVWVLFAIGMTGVNFAIDLLIFEKWLPEFLGHFRMC